MKIYKKIIIEGLFIVFIFTFFYIGSSIGNKVFATKPRRVNINGDNFALLLDDEKISTLPSAGVYLVSYTCDNNSKIKLYRTTGKLSLSKNTKVIETCSLVFKTRPLVSELPQGSYIAYEGNNGCLKNGTATASATKSGQGTDENANSCLGYNANANRDGTLDSGNNTYGFCYTGDYKYHVSGWRVAYTKDGRAYLISAGAPECTTRRNSTNGNKDYISDANLDAKKYCNSNFVDSCTSNNDVHAINDTDFNLITAEISKNTGGYLYTSISGATKCGGEYSKQVCGYNNDLIDNGGYYWFAAANSASSTDGVFWRPYYRFVNSDTATYDYGLRPIIRLSSSVYVTGGSGTPEDPYTIAK